MNIEIPKEIDITIGFEHKEAEQVAIWNIARHRDFLGLTDEDVDAIVKEWLQE